MAGKLLPSFSLNSPGDTGTPGRVEVSSTTGLHEGQRGNYAFHGYDPVEVVITNIASATLVDVRQVGDATVGPYGTTDITQYDPEDRLYYTGTVGTGVVTGTLSGATADVISSTDEYLVVENVLLVFQNGEELTFTAGGPGAAVGTVATYSPRLTFEEQFLYNPNDNPL